EQARRDGLAATLLPAEGAAPPRPSPASGRVTGQGGPGELRRHVRTRAETVEGLVDALLAPVVTVAGWEEGVELVLAHPDLVAVTPEGDRFSARGWRLGPSILRTKAALDEALSRAGEAEEVLAAVTERLRAARSEVAEVSAATAALRSEVEVHEGRLAELSGARDKLEAERGSLATEHNSSRAHTEGLAERVAAEEARIADLAAVLPALEAEEEASAERGLARQSARRQLDERAAALSALRTDLEVRAAALEERRGLLARRLEEVEARLHEEVERRQAADRSRGGLEGMAAIIGRLAALVADRLSLIESRLEELHERRRARAAAARAAAEHLAGLRRERSAMAERLEALRQRVREVDLEEAGLRLRAEATADALRRELDCGPEQALEATCPHLPEGTGPDERLSRVEDELRGLGPVNALALADHQALEERHGFLEGQLADVKSARQELGKVIRAIDSEISEVFAAAFGDVSENFAKLFASLFPGGTAQLRLSDPDDLLGTGIEVEARPSGKRVGKLSLLSGGERSLTALAFLFAVFRSRPSPFYLLDEVEAALDDVNLNRFLELVSEFREEAQLVLVSHQKRTMEAADCLYGVTMQPGGSSRVVSERAPDRAPAGAGGAPR
ncbi:MAG: AAA family ATPase, partial [Actinomycetota bacterium]|nr:AAA family ATPase [Actinomycetota bacterium]